MSDTIKHMWDQIERRPAVQQFEGYPDLAREIERMASTGTTGSLNDWQRFTDVLNAALTLPACTDAMVEAGARAICAHTGDDPDQKTYAHEMKCTGHDREPALRWEYWAPFSRAVLTSAFLPHDREAT